jgi:phage-related protein
VTTAGEIGIDIVPEMKDFGRRLSAGMKGAVDQADRQTRGLGSRLSSGIGGGLKSIGKAAAIGFGGIAVAAVAFGKQSVEAFTESNLVTQQTAAVLKSTAGAAGVTAKQVAGLAGAIRDYSGIDDEAIQSGENLLLTFTNIRNEAGKGNDVFNQATEAMANLSAALGQDTKSSAIQLGKALNDPVKGITALSRVGVSFTQQQKDQVKALVDAGDTMGAQKLILRELTKEFGGSAKAMGKANPAAILKSQIGDVEESVGKALMPVVQSLLHSLLPLIQQVAPILGGLVAQLATALGPALQALGPALAAGAQALGELVMSLAPLLPSIVKLFVALLPLETLITKIAVALVGLLVPALNVILGVLTVVVAAVVGFVVNWQRSWETVKSIAFAIWQGIKDVIGGAIGWVRNKITGVLSAIQRTWSNTWLAVKGFFLNVWEGIKSGLRSAVNFMIGWLNTLIHGINTVAEAAANAAAGPFAAFVNVPNIPDIPGVMLGTRDFAGGMVRVGEAGPETLILPEHSAVIPGRGGGDTYNTFNEVAAHPEDILRVLTKWDIERGWR